MYASTYDRLLGWLFTALGIAGLVTNHIGSYLTLSRPETGLNLFIGVVAMACARSRLRISTLCAMLIGILLFLWGIWGLAWPASFVGTAEPLEIAVHIVAGLWGMYVSVHDVNQWRHATA